MKIVNIICFILIIKITVGRKIKKRRRNNKESDYGKGRMNLYIDLINSINFDSLENNGNTEYLKNDLKKVKENLITELKEGNKNRLNQDFKEVFDDVIEKYVNVSTMLNDKKKYLTDDEKKYLSNLSITMVDSIIIHGENPQSKLTKLSDAEHKLAEIQYILNT